MENNYRYYIDGKIKMFNHRWLVVCDDETHSFQSREKARKNARWQNGHPANVNIRMCGPYKNVDGIARVIDLDRYA